MTVEDNGRGFDPGALESTAGSPSAVRRGNGLQSMAQRMQSVGGTFEQTSAVGQGTVTRLSVPLQKGSRPTAG